MHKQGDTLFSFTVFPLGSGSDVAGPVSQTIERIIGSGLDYQVTGTCTLVEGAWDDVLPVLEECMHELTEKHERVWGCITMDYHRNRSGRLKSSVGEVEEVLQHRVRSAP